MSDKSNPEPPSGYGPPEDAMTYEESPEEAGRGRMVLGLAAIMVIAAVAIIYVVFQHGIRKGGRDAPPVIIAESTPEKVKPEDPGGLEVPHQDKLVYDRVSGESTERVEKLLPEPEEPVDLTDIGLRTSTDDGDVEIGTIKTDEGEIEPAREEPIATPPAEPEKKPEVNVIKAGEPEADKVVKEAENIGDLIDNLASEEQDNVGNQVADVDSGTVERASGSIPPATSGAYVVQVASVPEPDAATKMWERLLQKNKDIFSNLRPDIQMADLGAKGVYYRLRVGPFATKDEAQRLCNTLKSRGQDCLVRKT